MNNCLNFFKRLPKNFIYLFYLFTQLYVSAFPAITKLTFAVFSFQDDFCFQILNNVKPQFNVFIELTEAVNKETSKYFIAPCPCCSFRYLIKGCSKFPLIEPLLEKLKVAVNFNSTNNLVKGGAPERL